MDKRFHSVLTITIILAFVAFVAGLGNTGANVYTEESKQRPIQIHAQTDVDV